MHSEKEWFSGLSTDESKEDRMHVRLWVARVLFLIAVAVLVAIATKAYAEEIKPAPTVLVAQLGENRLSLFQDACALGGWFMTWKKAQWFYKGRNVEACWKIQRHGDDGLLYAETVDADGDAGYIPITMFRKDEGA